MRPRIWLWVLFSGAIASSAIGAETAPKDFRHVVVVVWDGMRPEFVTAQNTPALWKLAREGVVFRDHHSVYFLATTVNGTALATGMYPAHSGLIANLEFRPLIDSHKPIDVSIPVVVGKGEELSRGNYIAAHT